MAIAKNFQLEYLSFTSNAVGKLEVVDGKYIMSEVILTLTVIIKNIGEKEKA